MLLGGDASVEAWEEILLSPLTESAIFRQHLKDS